MHKTRMRITLQHIFNDYTFLSQLLSYSLIKSFYKDGILELAQHHPFVL